MDIMKVNSMFMKRILSKMINHSIKKKTGIDADIKLGDIYISYNEEVFCYFKDSMTVKGVCEEDNTEEIERFATQQLLSETSEDSQCDSCDYDYDPRSGECYDCVKGRK